MVRTIGHGLHRWEPPWGCPWPAPIPGSRLFNEDGTPYTSETPVQHNVLPSRLAQDLKAHIPDAVVILYGGGNGGRADRIPSVLTSASKTVSVPALHVCRGFLVSEEGEAPVQHPPLGQHELEEANFKAVLSYHDTLVEAMRSHGRIYKTTFIAIRDTYEDDTILVSVLLY